MIAIKPPIIKDTIVPVEKLIIKHIIPIIAKTIAIQYIESI